MAASVGLVNLGWLTVIVGLYASYVLVRAGACRVVVSGKRPFGATGLLGGVVNSPDLERASFAGHIAGVVTAAFENGWYSGGSFHSPMGGVGPRGGDCFS